MECLNSDIAEKEIRREVSLLRSDDTIQVKACYSSPETHFAMLF